MLARFFNVSHNTQMLGIKHAYLMINKKLTKTFSNLKNSIMKKK